MCTRKLHAKKLHNIYNSVIYDIYMIFITILNLNSDYLCLASFSSLLQNIPYVSLEHNIAESKKPTQIYSFILL